MTDHDQDDELYDDDLEEEDSDEIDPAFYSGGGIIFSDPELELLGDIEGLKVLNLQPGTGEEALSLVNLGAGEVTVIDDERSIEDAVLLSQEAGVAANFVVADVNALPSKPSDGWTVRMIGRSKTSANSQSRSSWPGTAMIAPVPYPIRT